MGSRHIECPHCERGEVDVEPPPGTGPVRAYLVPCETCGGEGFLECEGDLCSVCAQVAEDLESKEVPFVVAE